MTVFGTFKKKLFFNRGINSTEKECCCFKGRYNEKWDRILATITAVLTFMLLLGYVIISALSEKKTPDYIDEDADSIIVRNETGGSSSSRDMDGLKCQATKYCSVTCSDFLTTDSITDHISEATKNVSCLVLHPLTIKDSAFSNQTIEEGWLRPLTQLVSYLVLTSCQITEIGTNAFSGHPFTTLTTVEMEDVPLKLLNNSAFNNTKIDTLSLTYTETHELLIEQDALDAIKSTLTTLNLKRCLLTADAITNLTGARGTSFPNLIQMYLSGNSLTHLPNNSFSNAPNLIQVFLDSNKISSVEPNAFKPSSYFSPIKILNLSNNDLSVLTEMVFSYFEDDAKIDVRNNPWNCSCNLQWLKDWYENHTALNISDSLLCANENNKKFYEIDFGCQEGNASTRTTGPPSTSPSGQTTFDYIQLYCTNSEAASFPVYYDEWPYFPICVRISLMELEIYEVDAEAATYEVKVTGKVEDSHVMWYNTKNKSDYGCVTNVDDRFVMENLEREATYTICALYGDEVATSPYDCVGFTVPVEWGSRTWIPNKLMKFVIGGLCGILLFEAVIIGLVVFYCIRQHPKFISGNKRVVVVSTKTTDAVIMPRIYSQSVTKALPTVPSTPGYLTPKYSRNDKRKRMLRSMSESSVLSGSYINKEEIYHRRRKETTLYEMSDEEHIYESPALPPNHPSEVRKQCYK